MYYLMKSNKLAFVLVLSSTLLAGCNITNSANSSILPEGASSVDEATASKKLAAAVQNLGNDGSFGIKLENLNVGLDASINIPDVATEGSSVTAGIKSATIGGSVTNASFYAGIQGLTSANAADVKAQVEGKADVAYSVKSDEGMIGESSQSQAQAYNNAKAGAYIANSNAYIDFSDTTFVTLANAIGTAFGTIHIDADDVATFAPAFTVPQGKYVMKDIFTKEKITLPLLSTEIQGQLATYGAAISTGLDAYKAYFDTYTYSNGNYALDLKLSKEKIVAIVAQATASKFSSSAKASAFQNTVTTVLNFLTINAGEIAIVYNESGLVSFATDINVVADCSYFDLFSAVSGESVDTSGLPSNITSAKEHVAFNFNCKLNFLSGKDVTITLPSDLDTYSETK
jgi:hypothetical protein